MALLAISGPDIFVHIWRCPDLFRHAWLAQSHACNFATPNCLQFCYSQGWVGGVSGLPAAAVTEVLTFVRLLRTEEPSRTFVCFTNNASLAAPPSPVVLTNISPQVPRYLGERLRLLLHQQQRLLLEHSALQQHHK